MLDLSYEFALEASDWSGIFIDAQRSPTLLVLMKRKQSSGPDSSRQSAPLTSVCALLSKL